MTHLLRALAASLVVVSVGACAGDGDDADAGAASQSSAGSGAGGTTTAGPGTGGASSGGTSSAGSSAGGTGTGGASAGGMGSGGMASGGMGTGGTSMASASSSASSASSSASSTAASSSASGGGGSDACGFPLSGVWFEIDYSSATTATNPAWTFSPTSWGASDWAPAGETFPEVWDVYNNIPVSNDPIGKLAVVGPSSTLQIMIGLGGMTSYSKVTVCIEGRSVSATASVQFDVYNPLNNCGASASMPHSWQVHTAAVDLGTCLIAGNDFQAIRVEPWGGSATVGVKRLTVALQGAVY